MYDDIPRYPTCPSAHQLRVAADLLESAGAGEDELTRRAMRMAITLGAVRDVVDRMADSADLVTALDVARLRAHLDAYRDAP